MIKATHGSWLKEMFWHLSKPCISLQGVGLTQKYLWLVNCSFQLLALTIGGELCLSNWNVITQGLRRQSNIEIQETKPNGWETSAHNFLNTIGPFETYVFINNKPLDSTEWLWLSKCVWFPSLLVILSYIFLNSSLHTWRQRRWGIIQFHVSLFPLGISAKLTPLDYWTLAAFNREGFLKYGK